MPFGADDAVIETNVFGANDEIIEESPVAVFDEKTAGQVYDTSVESELPIDEVENIYGITEQPKEEGSENIAKRFGKQFYNSAVANTVNAMMTKGKIGKETIRDKAASQILAEEREFYERARSGGPISLSELNTYLSPRQIIPHPTDYTKNEIRWVNRSDEDIELWLKAKRGDIMLELSDTQVLPFFSKKRIQSTIENLQAKTIEEEGIQIDVEQAEDLSEKITDAAAGVAGFTAQIAIMKKAAPTMPDWLAWENVNLANGGTPGHGAMMQLTLGGLNRLIPGPGFVPAVERGTVASAFFGTTTYLGGGDTTDILINAGIPFAFEAIGMTKQSWAKYKNKQSMIDAIKQKAPGLNNRSNIEIERSVTNLLTNVEMRQRFAPKKPLREMSTELQDYMQRMNYDRLLERANAGDKAAVKALNDYIQGVNVPTYDQLLERGFNGDPLAFDLINAGQYKGGANEPAPTIPSKVPKKKPGVDFTQPKTPIQKIKDQVRFAENVDVRKGKISKADQNKARERGFITSAKEIVPEMKVEGQYIPRETDPLAIKSRNLVYDNIDKAEQVRKGTSDKSVAVASELIKYYGEMGGKAKTKVEADMYYEKAATVASETAVILTEAGRTVQAASILGRMTPEGQVRFAAREIQRYNEKITKAKGGIGGLKKKIPELTGQQSKYILEEMAEINKMPEGKKKYVRFQKLQDHISDLVPTPTYKKLVTVWKAGLLTGIKTSGLNIFSNAGHLGTETIKDIPATAIDKVASYFTGKRTVTPTVKGLGKGTLEGLGKGFEYLKSGYSERDIGTKLDYTKINYGKGNTAKALRAYTEGVFRVLGAEDQPFYYAAKLRSMYEQAKVSAINLKLKGKAAQDHINNLIENPTEQMIKNASMDAEAAVFINSTKLGDIARGIQQLPGGEIVVPFGRTPSAVAMQIVNYSPAGIAKTIIENIGEGRFDQRAFSQGIGRGLTGTAVLVIGAKLYDQGLITLDYPKNEKERKLWELEGRQANSIKVDDKWRTIQSFGPAGNLLVVGGHFQRAFDEAGSPTAAMAEALSGSAKSFTEQTFLRGVNQFSDALSDPQRSAPMVVGSTLSSIIPTIAADVARASDPTQRRAETVGERFLLRVPGARRTLEPSIDVLGQEREATANPIEIMIDPTRPSEDISTPVVDELRRLWNEGWEVSPNLLGGKKGYDVLTQEENTELWKRAGDITNKALDSLVNNALYPDIPDEKKATLISRIISEAQNAARTEMVARKLSGVEADDLSEMIFELRRSGLASEEIIPIALSKRNPRKVRKLEGE